MSAFTNNVRKALEVMEQQRRPFVRREAACETDRQNIR